jgi:hypothetical protein
MINSKIIRKLLFFLPKRIMLWFVINNYTFVVALVYKAFIIKERKSKHKSPIRNSDKITILALNGNRFRGDLECLSGVENFRVLTLESMWQTILMYAFTRTKVVLSDYIHAETGSDIYLLKEKINIFFNGFISAILKLIKIDCVITVNYRYVEDLPWVMHFEKKGIPHICLFRENLAITDRFIDSLTAQSRRCRGYPVTHVIAGNQMIRDSFVKSGFVTEGQASVCGVLRMDILLKLINSGNSNLLIINKNRRKRVILFYFSYQLPLFGKKGLSLNDRLSDNATKYSYATDLWPKRIDLFEDLHMSFIQLAIKYPEVDFVLKPKREDMSKSALWDGYIKFVNKSGIDLSRLKNYTIEPDANVHDLIMNSDVIIALQSTAPAESAIAGKPVIFPLFYNFRQTKNFNDFIWKDYLDLFDVAEGPDELESLVVERLRNPEVNENIMEGRWGLFKKVFSDIEGVALERYVETIKNVLNSATSRNQN